MSAVRGTAQFWRDRAEKARTSLKSMTDPDTKRAITQVIENYEKFARIIESKEATGFPQREGTKVQGSVTKR